MKYRKVDRWKGFLDRFSISYTTLRATEDKLANYRQFLPFLKESRKRGVVNKVVRNPCEPRLSSFARLPVR